METIRFVPLASCFFSFLFDNFDQNAQLQDDTLSIERSNREIRQKIKDLEAEVSRSVQEIDSIMPKISQQQIKEQQILDELSRLGTPRLDMREVQTIMDSNVQVVECIKQLSSVLQPRRS
jgi:septal ring factor EnvC (AmiA/AmiB activator)